MKRKILIGMMILALITGTINMGVLGESRELGSRSDEPIIQQSQRPVRNKTFYMYRVRDAVGVGDRTTKEISNTTIPAEEGNVTDPSNFKVIVDWYLYPTLAEKVNLDGTSILTVWVKANNPDNKQMTYSLYELDSQGNEYHISSNTEEMPISTDWSTSSVSIDVDNYTLSQGSSLKVTYLLWGDASHWYEIAYGGEVEGEIRDTNVTLPCRDYIQVSDIYTTDHEGEVTNIFDPEAENKTIYIYANITNPFGGYDIHWVNLTLEGPDGMVLDSVGMEKIFGHFNSFESGYRYEWNYSDEKEGTYEISVRAVDNTGYRSYVQNGDFRGHEVYGEFSFVIGGLDHYVNILVADDHGVVLPNVTIHLKVSQHVVFSTNITDNEGIANFTVANATYIITVIWQDVEVSVNRTLNVDLVGNRTRDDPFEVTAGVFYPTFVVRDMEGWALDSANLYVKHPNGTSFIEPLVTDEMGETGLEQVPEGLYEIQVDWKGRDVGMFSVDVESSDDHVLHAYVYHLYLFVIDHEGEPVPNSLFVASYNDTLIVAESKLTDEDGELFTRLPATEYLFEIYWKDAQVYQGTHILDATETLYLTVGIYDVSVTILDSLEDPLADAEVTATYVRTGREIDTVSTDADGLAWFRLASGEHGFDVRWMGTEVASETRTVSETQRDFTILTEVYQLSMITFDGTEDKGILPNARISVILDGQVVDTGVTDDAGAYVSKLPGTAVDIEVEWLGIHVLTLEDYTVEGNLDLELICDVYYLDITTEDSRENPVEGVDLRMEYNGEPVTTGTTDTYGQHRARLPLETYTIRARWYGVEVGMTEYSLSPGTSELTLPCQIYYLTVTAMDSDDHTLQSVQVNFHIEGEVYFSEVTDTDGSLVIRLPMEEYLMTFEWRGFTVGEMTSMVDDDRTVEVRLSVYNVDITTVDSRDENVSDTVIEFVHNGEIFEILRTSETGNVSLKVPNAEFEIIVRWQGVEIYRGDRTFEASEEFVLPCDVYYLNISGVDSRDTEVLDLVVAVYHTGLPEGQQLLTTISFEEHPSLRVPHGDIRLEGEWRGFYVADDVITVNGDIEFVLECDIYYLDVTVTDSEGVVLHGANLVLKDHTGTAFVTEVTDAGAALPRLPAGLWTLEAYWREQKVGTMTIDIENDDVEFTFQTSVHYLRVTVEGKKGPVEGVELTLLDNDGTHLMSILTDENGRVEFPQIVEGRYTLLTHLKTTQHMTNIDIEQSEEVTLDSSRDLSVEFEDYPLPFYTTNLFYVILAFIVLIAMCAILLTRKKEVI